MQASDLCPQHNASNVDHQPSPQAHHPPENVVDRGHATIFYVHACHSVNICASCYYPPPPALGLQKHRGPVDEQGTKLTQSTSGWVGLGWVLGPLQYLVCSTWCTSCTPATLVEERVIYQNSDNKRAWVGHAYFAFPL
eukprot:645642-Pelagomonas_calceolata.AAC.4